MDIEAEIEALRRRLPRDRGTREALATLVATDATFVGTHWVKPFDPAAGSWPVLAACVSAYGADAEEIPPECYVPLARLVERFGPSAVEAWACHRRGIAKPPKGELSEQGKLAFAALMSGGITGAGASTAAA